MSERTVDTVYGPLPVLDVLRQCRYMKGGRSWTGINEKGERVNVYSKSKDVPATIQTMDHFVIVRAAVGNEPCNAAGHVPVGAIMVERAARARVKRKPLTVVKG